MSHRFMTGDTVRVDGQVVVIRQVLSDVPGGYLVDRPVAGFRYWNQDEMRPVADDLAALRARLDVATGLLRDVRPTAPALRDAIDAFLDDSPATPEGQTT